MRQKILAPALAGLASLAISIPLLPAQTAITYPAHADGTELPDLEFWALSPFAAHRQVLLDAGAVGIRPGLEIEALLVRRDGDTVEGVLGGRVQVRLMIGNAPRSAAHASEEFAANLGARPSVVFDGIVALPTLGAPTDVPSRWTGRDAIRLPFSTPWRAGGTTICIDTLTEPFVDSRTGIADAPFWPIDMARPATNLAGIRAGISCIAGPDPTPAGLLAEALQPGATMQFHLAHAPANGALMCIVGTARASSLPLDPVGAPGCALHVNPITTLVPLSPISIPRELARARLPLPNLTELGGFEIASQWIAVTPGATPLGVVTSNRAAGVLQVATSPWEATWIESTDVDATHGMLFPHRSPVLRFELR